MEETVSNPSLFVAGATGFVGKALVARGRAAGYRVVAHVRPDSAQLEKWQAHFAGLGAEVSTAAWQAEAMTQELQRLGPAVVFCCIGTTQKRMGRDGKAANSYEAIDYGLTKLLADASHNAGCVQRFVYLSSLGAGPKASGAYLQWRHRAEEAVRQSGVAWTIARPSIITGDRDEERPAEHYAGVVLDGLLQIVGALGASTLRDRYRSNDDGTLAQALLRLAFDPQQAGQVVLSENLHL